jgi:hypothetical protein
MTTFDERGQAFEKKYALDEESRFKAVARRNKLLGLWAAAKLGLMGAQAEAYAQDVVRADLHEPGEKDLLSKLEKDFKAKGITFDAKVIHQQIEQFTAQAVEQVKKAG